MIKSRVRIMVSYHLIAFFISLIFLNFFLQLLVHQMFFLSSSAWQWSFSWQVQYGKTLYNAEGNRFRQFEMSEACAWKKTYISGCTFWMSGFKVSTKFDSELRNVRQHCVAQYTI
jgi:hypothetical protein